jgi:hypothetical protein
MRRTCARSCSDRAPATAGGAGRFTLARFLPSGALDASFGTSGIAQAEFEQQEAEAIAVARQPDGKLVIVGTVFHAFGLARFLAPGGPIYDICIQDDDSGDSLEFNSVTGAFTIVSCGTGATVSGLGTVRQAGGCKLRLTSIGALQVKATVNRCRSDAKATVRDTAAGTTTRIVDRNLLDDTCGCK